LKCVITTSEILDQASRDLIESVFDVKVYNEYGCGEVGSIAHECEHGNMHIMASNLIVEIDNSGQSDEYDGEIIVTDLHNYSMPLIRYRLGDYAEFSDSDCRCGRGLPIIKKIHGRAYDIVVDPANYKHHPEILMYIFEDIKRYDSSIKQFQVVQTDKDQLMIRLVTDTNYTDGIENIIQKMVREKVHPEIKTKFEYVEAIEREASGKLRVIKSMLN
jgi:phenylacetate-CoA ligase